ncbi:MAG: glutathione peroxidase [Candidatus Eisenbacteria bacterium]|nr:glutathione peroxidase [Candidatus Eisenbacteria bacterium]
MSSRFVRLTLTTLALAATLLPGAGLAKTPAGGRPVQKDIYGFEVLSIKGNKVPLSSYKGKVLLVVNTASRCGFTPQYEGLEALYQKYRAQGFEVLAFPANDFLSQEPGTDEEIEEFCSTRFGTKFPLFSKIHVKGGKIAPLYSWLTKDSAFPGDVEWNFTKFLIGPDGKVVARFPSKVKPLAPEITGQIETLLASRAAR